LILSNDNCRWTTTIDFRQNRAFLANADMIFAKIARFSPTPHDFRQNRAFFANADMTFAKITRFSPTPI
jgi:hypothetical protein